MKNSDEKKKKKSLEIIYFLEHKWGTTTRVFIFDSYCSVDRIRNACVLNKYARYIEYIFVILYIICEKPLSPHYLNELYILKNRLLVVAYSYWKVEVKVFKRKSRHS